MNGRRRFLSRTLALTLLCPGLLFASAPPLPNFPPLEFHPPKPQRFVLPNGLIVFLLEDHELPLIRVETITHAGSQYDASGKLGLSAVFGEAMTLGGSAAHTPEEIERLLDTTAAGMRFSAELENASGSMSCRAQDFDRVFSAFTDLLLHPMFRKDHVELPKGKLLEALRRMNDDPEEMTRREFRRLVYGPDHPYSRVPSPTTLGALRREDLVAMHDLYFHPNTTLIAVSGEFNSAEMRKKIEAALGAWKRAEVKLPLAPVPQEPAGKQVFSVQWPVNQSQIRMGGLGIERHNPDHFAWEVFNELWGGTATSRLFREVRTQQGLAYSVGSAFSEPAQKGLIVAVSQTRGTQTVAAVNSILKISRELSQAPFSAAEIQTAEESIINRFVEHYTSSAQIAAEVMNFEYFGYPSDYLETYTRHVGQVNAQDLKRVASRYLHPDSFKILVVGDLKSFDTPVSSLGDVRPLKPLDYSQETH
jgi:zinc protease